MEPFVARDDSATEYVSQRLCTPILSRSRILEEKKEQKTEENDQN